MPVVLHSAGIWPTRIWAVQSLMSFMIPLGQTIGIAVMGAVFTNKFNSGLVSVAADNPGANISTSGPANLNILNDLPPATKDAVQNAAARAVMWAFIAILPFMALSIVAALFLGNVWIGKDAKRGKDGKAAREEVKGQVLYGSLILSALKGNVKRDRQDLDQEVKEGKRQKRSDAEADVLDGPQEAKRTMGAPLA